MYFQGYQFRIVTRRRAAGKTDFIVLARAAIRLEDELPDANGSLAVLEVGFEKGNTLIGGGAESARGARRRTRRAC
jgi:hypothetical protein